MSATSATAATATTAATAEPPPPTWERFAGRVPFRLGVVSSELGNDFERVCAVAAATGIAELELHTLWGRQVTELSDEEARHARDIVQAHGVRVCLITGPAFKAVPLEAIAAQGELETPLYAKHRRLLEREIELAHLFGTDRVRLFAFLRPKGGEGGAAEKAEWHSSPDLTAGELETVRRGFAPLVDLAGRQGVTLMVENVRYSYADTGAHSAQILKEVDSPRVRLIWDPANALVAGEARPYPDGYAAVQPYVAQVHAKDAAFTDRVTGSTEWRRIGDGEVDWAGQLRALLDAGYPGVLSLETHWQLPGDGPDVRERSTLETWRGLASILDQLLLDQTLGAGGAAR
jgi:sugar phosphate isomerase/epimerase